MQISKWGNSLAVRIPVDVARALGLKEGDEVELRRAEDGALELGRDERRALALKRIRELARPFPADYRFDRDEANAR